jgi:hypothetical protein
MNMNRGMVSKQNSTCHALSALNKIRNPNPLSEWDSERRFRSALARRRGYVGLLVPFLTKPREVRVRDGGLAATMKLSAITLNRDVTHFQSLVETRIPIPRVATLVFKMTPRQGLELPLGCFEF